MKSLFLTQEKAVLTVMLQCETPETAIMRMRNALTQGAEAFGLQAESLKPEYQNPETFQWLFSEMQGRPVYVTNYRSSHNAGKTDEELAEGLVALAECGATLCDVIGDLFCPHPEQMTDDAAAIQKQMELIDRLHSKGAEVLMSSHLSRFTPAERILEMALEQKRRGADVIKIVTRAETMEQQIENLRISQLLKQELGARFLFLSGGESTVHRRIGWKFGSCMILCVYEHDHLSTPQQPLLKIAKQIRDDLGF